jgi:hypothetical protein
MKKRSGMKRENKKEINLKEKNETKEKKRNVARN